jgi:L,D-peptidoglycan transpeptidase YkuD (ErfK/YbiS/YcfS/YnhG family)
LPYPSSAEQLWCDDHIYDIIVLLGFNDDPVLAGRGSCIFWHIREPGRSPTDGRVGVTLDQLLAVLAIARPPDSLTITADV